MCLKRNRKPNRVLRIGKVPELKVYQKENSVIEETPTMYMYIRNNCVCVKILDNATPFAQRNLIKKKKTRKLYIESKSKLRRS